MVAAVVMPDDRRSGGRHSGGRLGPRRRMRAVVRGKGNGRGYKGAGDK